MIILSDDIHVDFTPIERNQLDEALSVATRLYTSLSEEMQTTSDFGISAFNIRTGINYLLGNGGTDNSLDIGVKIDPTIVDADKYDDIMDGMAALAYLINYGKTPSYYLPLDLELPVTIDNVEIPASETPVMFNIYQNRTNEEYTYHMEYQFSFVNETQNPDWKVAYELEYSYDDETDSPLWTLGDDVTYYKITNGVAVEIPAATMASTYTLIKQALDQYSSDYCLVLNHADFIPSASLNWINHGNQVTTNTQLVYDALSALMVDYAPEESTDPVLETYEIDFTWPNMPEGAFTFVLSNNYVNVNVTMTHDNDTEEVVGGVTTTYSHSDTIVLSNYPGGGAAEDPYIINASSIPYDTTFKNSSTPITQITHDSDGANITIEAETIHAYVPWHYVNYVKEGATTTNVGFPEDAGDLTVTIYNSQSDTYGSFIVNEDNLGGTIEINDNDLYTISANAHFMIDNVDTNNFDYLADNINIHYINSGENFVLTVNSEVVDTYFIDDNTTSVGSTTLVTKYWTDSSGDNHVIPYELDAGYGNVFNTGDRYLDVTTAGTYTIVSESNN